MPYDVGAVPVKIPTRIEVGQLAPDLKATTLDGKPLRLSDFRGKYLVIAFWTKSGRSDFTLAESRSLRALHKTFGKLERFAMLGISSGMEVDRCKKLVAQRGWEWFNAVVSWEDWEKFLDENSPQRSGLVWLIGPDGKVLARDLRGDSIRQAGTMVLRAR